MLGFVGEQRLGGGQTRGGRTRLAQLFFVGDADAVVKGAPPASPGDRLEAMDSFLGHECAAFVTTGDEREVVVELLQLGSQAGARRVAVLATDYGLQAADFRITLEYFKAHPYLVDPVMNGFQFGRLVHHVFGCGDLAAVVQPGSLVQRLPVIGGQLKVPVRAMVLVAGGTCQHLGPFRDACAMATGVRALGVDRRGDKLDECLEEIFLRLDQRLAFERHRRRSREGFHEAQAGLVGGHVAQQQHRTDQFGLSVEQWHGYGIAGASQVGVGAADRGEVLGLQAAGACNAVVERCAKQRAGARDVEDPVARPPVQTPSR